MSNEKHYTLCKCCGVPFETESLSRDTCYQCKDHFNEKEISIEDIYDKIEKDYDENFTY